LPTRPSRHRAPFACAASACENRRGRGLSPAPRRSGRRVCSCPCRTRQTSSPARPRAKTGQTTSQARPRSGPPHSRYTRSLFEGREISFLLYSFVSFRLIFRTRSGSVPLASGTCKPLQNAVLRLFLSDISHNLKIVHRRDVQTPSLSLDQSSKMCARRTTSVHSMHTNVVTTNTNCPAFPKKAQLSQLANLTSVTRHSPEEKRPLAPITRKDRLKR
jgi:hypothetical protein